MRRTALVVFILAAGLGLVGNSPAATAATTQCDTAPASEVVTVVGSPSPVRVKVWSFNRPSTYRWVQVCIDYSAVLGAGSYQQFTFQGHLLTPPSNYTGYGVVCNGGGVHVDCGGSTGVDTAPQVTSVPGGFRVVLPFRICLGNTCPVVGGSVQATVSTAMPGGELAVNGVNVCVFSSCTPVGGTGLGLGTAAVNPDVSGTSTVCVLTRCLPNISVSKDTSNVGTLWVVGIPIPIAHGSGRECIVKTGTACP